MTQNQASKKKPKKRNTQPRLPPSQAVAVPVVEPGTIPMVPTLKRRKTCFVVMPIGDQHLGEHKVPAAELRKKYTDLIRDAIQAVRDDIDVVRADDVVAGGGITNDIFDRLMKSDYVIADISYPNPNVYYELGLRHACRVGTIPVRDRRSPFSTPFDIQDLRYIEYEDTSSGLKELKGKLEQRLAWIDNNLGTPDSKFLEYAQYIKFEFPKYGQDPHVEVADVMMGFLKYPELIQELMEQRGGKPDPRRMMQLMTKYPDVARNLILFMSRQGKMPLPF